MMRAVMRAARDPVFLIDRDGILISANDAFAALYNKTPDEITGTPVADLWPADVASRRFRFVRRALRTGKRVRFDEESVRKRHFDVVIEPILNGRGEVAQLAFFTRDISRRKRAEAKLKASEDRYRMLYQDNPTMYFTVDPNGQILSVNTYGAQHLGYEPEELIGRPVLEVFHPDDQKAVLRQFRACLANPGQAADWEFRKLRKTGETMWVKETARATTGPDSETIVLIVCEDITERRRMEDDLQQAREELERKVEKTLEKEVRYDLTFRQLTVLHLVAQGKSDREIGLALGISPLTVNTHVSRALRKMGASSRTEAGVRALREGLIE
jgi:PAS domain S-box-containing protein